MSIMPGNMVKKAGDYLLSVLASEPSIRYSRFYDATDATRERLRLGVGLSQADADYYCMELMMDLAVSMFEKRKLVQTRYLEEKLADDEPDYEICLTDEGTRFITEGRDYASPDVEL